MNCVREKNGNTKVRHLEHEVSCTNKLRKLHRDLLSRNVLGKKKKAYVLVLTGSRILPSDSESGGRGGL